jgi:hypothetical protein
MERSRSDDHRRGDDALSFPSCESTKLSRELSGDPKRKWLEFFPNWRSTEAASLPVLVMWELSIKLWHRQRSLGVAGRGRPAYSTRVQPSLIAAPRELLALPRVRRVQCDPRQPTRAHAPANRSTTPPAHSIAPAPCSSSTPAGCKHGHAGVAAWSAAPRTTGATPASGLMPTRARPNLYYPPSQAAPAGASSCTNLSDASR